MSVTVVHRPGVHVPWLQVALIVAIAAVTVLAVALAVQLSSTPPAHTTAQSAGADAGAATATGAEAAKNRSPVVHAVMLGESTASAPAAAPALSLKRAGTPRAAGQGR